MKRNLFRAAALLLCLLTVTSITSIRAEQISSKPANLFAPVTTPANIFAVTPVKASFNLPEWKPGNAKTNPFTIYVKMDYVDYTGSIVVDLSFYSDEQATIPVEVSSLTVNYTHTEVHPFFGVTNYNWNVVCSGSYQSDILGGPYWHFEPLSYPYEYLYIERRTSLRTGAYIALLTDPYYS